MAIEVMQWVWDHSLSRNGGRLVLLAIADNCNSSDGTGAWPSMAELKRKTLLSESAIQTATKELEKLGELRVLLNGGPKGRNRYTVIMTPPDTEGVQNLGPSVSGGVHAPESPQEDAQTPPVSGGPPDTGPPQILGSNPPESGPVTIREPSSTSLAPKSAKQKTTRGTRIPADFKITPEMEAWGRANAPNIDGALQTQKFIDHYAATPGAKGVKLDWPAAWRNWIRNAVEWAPRSTPQTTSTPVVAAVPWCGTCSNPARQIENHIGALIPCPTCSPHRRTP